MEQEPQTIPWQKLKIDGRDSYLEDETGYAARLLQALSEAGINPAQVLLAGIDAEPVERSGTFGDRPTTFAVTADEMMIAARQMDEYGSSNFQNPLRYADELSTSPDEPRQSAIAVFDADAFEPVATEDKPDVVVLEGDANWQLRPGIAMDDAVKAIVHVI